MSTAPVRRPAGSIFLIISGENPRSGTDLWTVRAYNSGLISKARPNAAKNNPAALDAAAINQTLQQAKNPSISTQPQTTPIVPSQSISKQIPSTTVATDQSINPQRGAGIAGGTGQNVGGLSTAIEPSTGNTKVDQALNVIKQEKDGVSLSDILDILGKGFAGYAGKDYQTLREKQLNMQSELWFIFLFKTRTGKDRDLKKFREKLIHLNNLQLRFYRI